MQSLPDALPTGRYFGQTRSRKQVADFLLTESSYTTGTHLPRHSHQNPHFCLVVAGEYIEQCERQRHEWGPATLLYLPPGNSHEEYHTRSGRHFIIEILPEGVERLRTHLGPLEQPRHWSQGPMTWLATRVYEEFQSGDGVSDLMIEGLGLELLAATSRLRLGDVPSRPKWLLRAQEMIRERFRENVSPTEIAREVGVHPVHLSRVFRRCFRGTIGEYVRKLRVESACQMIRETPQKSLAEVATDNGFADQSHLTRTFKTITGLTPAQYRATYRHA